MISPETLAAALRVAQHGAHRAMLAAHGDDAVDHPQGTDSLLVDRSAMPDGPPVFGDHRVIIK